MFENTLWHGEDGKQVECMLSFSNYSNATQPFPSPSYFVWNFGTVRWSSSAPQHVYEVDIRNATLRLLQHLLQNEYWSETHWSDMSVCYVMQQHFLSALSCISKLRYLPYGHGWPFAFCFVSSVPNEMTGVHSTSLEQLEGFDAEQLEGFDVDVLFFWHWPSSNRTYYPSTHPCLIFSLTHIRKRER